MTGALVSLQLRTRLLPQCRIREPRILSSFEFLIPMAKSILTNTFEDFFFLIMKTELTSSVPAEP